MTTNGWIIMDCYTDDACIEYTPEGPKPIITGISSIMPVVGSEVTITGQNFIDVSNINLNIENANDSEKKRQTIGGRRQSECAGFGEDAAFFGF